MKHNNKISIWDKNLKKPKNTDEKLEKSTQLFISKMFCFKKNLFLISVYLRQNSRTAKKAVGWIRRA